MKVWIDGQLIDDEHAVVSAYDHGFVVGDGVFETMKVEGGKAFAVTRHLERLARSADGLRLPVDVERIARAIREVLATNDADTARLRVTVTGGPSGLSSDRGDAGPTVVVAIAPMTPWPPTADVVIVPWSRNEYAATVGTKTTSYADNVVALQYAHDRGAAEAIFANTQGNLCEGTGSNVFVVVEGRLITPPLSSGCLAGVTRALILEWVGAVEEDVPVEALATADEAFLASSTRDIQPVATVDGTRLPAAPGLVTANAIDVFAEKSAGNPDP